MGDFAEKIKEKQILMRTELKTEHKKEMKLLHEEMAADDEVSFFAV